MRDFCIFALFWLALVPTALVVTHAFPFSTNRVTRSVKRIASMKIAFVKIDPLMFSVSV